MNEDKKIAYKFTDKETGTIAYGLLYKSGNGVDTFRLTTGENVDVPNPDATGIVTETEKYLIEKDEDYKGELLTWEIE